MRFASIVTVAAAIVGAPLLASANGPQMDAETFVGAVRCAAYDNLSQFQGDNPALAQTMVTLNLEARQQSAETAARARDEAAAIARHGATASLLQLRDERAAACASDMTNMVADARTRGEV